MKVLCAFLLFLGITSCNTVTDKKVIPDSLPEPQPVLILMDKISKSPDSVGLHLQLVNTWDSLGEGKKALAAIDQLIKTDSLNYAFWYRKAQLQESTQDTAGAITSYRYAVRIYPSPDAILASANLLAERKDPASLILCNQVAGLRMGGEYTAHCHFITGVYYARKADYPMALRAFNQCIYNDYQYMEAYMEKGFILYNTEKIKEALQVFQTACKVKNNYPDGYYWQAKCYEKLDNKPAAITNYQDALTLDPKLKEAREALIRLGVK